MKRLAQQRKFEPGFKTSERAFVVPSDEIAAIANVGGNVVPFILRKLETEQFFQCLESDLLKIIRRQEREDSFGNTYQRTFFDYDIVEHDNELKVRGRMTVRRFIFNGKANVYTVYFLELDGVVKIDLNEKGQF